MTKEQSAVLKLIRHVAHAFAEAHHPDELPYFPLIWEECAKQIDVENIHPDQVDGTQLLRLGLPFADEQRLRLTVPQTILTIAAVLNQLRGMGVDPTEEQLNDAVRACARAFGVSKDETQKLVAHVSPALHHAIGEGSSAGLLNLTDPAPASDARDESPARWVEWWLDGVHKRPVQDNDTLPVDDRRPVGVSLVIDEIAGQFVGVNGPWSFGKCTPRSLIGMWLALDRTGSHFSFADINTARGLPKTEVLEERSVKKPVYEAQKLLTRLVGKPLIPKPKRQRYYIEMDAWSWCWIRSSESRLTSLLLGKQVLKNGHTAAPATA